MRDWPCENREAKAQQNLKQGGRCGTAGGFMTGFVRYFEVNARLLVHIPSPQFLAHSQRNQVPLAWKRNPKTKQIAQHWTNPAKTNERLRQDSFSFSCALCEALHYLHYNARQSESKACCLQNTPLAIKYTKMACVTPGGTLPWTEYMHASKKIFFNNKVLVIDKQVCLAYASGRTLEVMHGPLWSWLLCNTDPCLP